MNSLMTNGEVLKVYRSSNSSDPVMRPRRLLAMHDWDMIVASVRTRLRISALSRNGQTLVAQRNRSNSFLPVIENSTSGSFGLPTLACVSIGVRSAEFARTTQ